MLLYISKYRYHFDNPYWCSKGTYGRISATPVIDAISKLIYKVLKLYVNLL